MNKNNRLYTIMSKHPLCSSQQELEKLCDVHKKLKMSHKKLEKLVMDYRNLLIAMQNNLSFAICPKCIEKKLRYVNLALGYNQWANVKEVKGVF